MGEPKEAEGVTRSDYEGGEDKSAEFIRCKSPPLHFKIPTFAIRADS
jgi:hypothetical protein